MSGTDLDVDATEAIVDADEQDVDESRGPLMTRRGVLRGAAATAGAAAAGGTATQLGYGPVEDAEAITCGGLCIAGASVAIGAVAGYAVNEHFGGNGVDKDALKEAAAKETHLQARQTAAQIWADQKTFVTQTENVNNLSIDASIQDGVAAGVLDIINGTSKSTAVSSAKDAVDTFFANNQKNLFKQYKKLATDIDTTAEEVGNTSALTVEEVFYIEAENSSNKPTDDLIYEEWADTYNYTLVDGSTYELPKFVDIRWQTTGTVSVRFNDTGGQVANKIYVKPYDTGDKELFFDRIAFKNILTNIESFHSQAITKVDSIVGDLFDKYQDGAISKDRLLAASDLGQFAQSGEKASEAAQIAAVFGLPISDPALTVAVEDENGNVVERDGLLFMRNPPSDGLSVGVEINPAGLPGNVYFAYNATAEDGSKTAAKVELTEPFTIVQAEGGGPVTFSSNTDPVTETQTDIESYTEKITSYSEAKQEAKERQIELVLGGGGGGLGGLIPGGNLLPGLPPTLQNLSPTEWAIVGTGGFVGFKILTSD
jgi:hypothetical protein